MRQFFKFMFASLTGTLIAFFLAFLLLFAMILGTIASVGQMGADKVVEIKPHSIYAPDLSKPIVERKPENPLEGFDMGPFNATSGIALPKLLESIEDAKYDPKIDGLFLDLSIVAAGRTSILAIKKAVEDFKASGKPVYAYADFYTSSSYALAVAADSIFMQPTGVMEFSGMVTEMMFFKGALDKLEIEPRVIKHGRYKSAGEPFSNTKMSEANREQNRELINSLYDNYLAEISRSRGMDTAELRDIAYNMKVRNAEDAVKFGLVDRLVHHDYILQKWRSLTGDENIEKVKLVGYSDYRSSHKSLDFKENKVAVVYANGSITMGDGSYDQIGSEGLSKAIRKARLNKEVKAIVLRVNSPGGSALASDVILREVELAKKEKPVIVSMGDVAASGGYYISCKANRIIAQPNTITGSIGVIGFLVGTQKFFENKLGITYDRVKTGKYADLGNPNREMTDEERAIITHMLDEIYVDFITHVAEGRGMDTSKVNELGRGRVWTGQQALENGLVDELGGMDLAIEVAAREAGLADGDYKILEYPELKSAFEEFFSNFGATIKENMLKEELGVHYQVFKKLKEVEQYNGPMMLMPFEY